MSGQDKKFMMLVERPAHTSITPYDEVRLSIQKLKELNDKVDKLFKEFQEMLEKCK